MRCDTDTCYGVVHYQLFSWRTNWTEVFLESVLFILNKSCVYCSTCIDQAELFSELLFCIDLEIEYINLSTSGIMTYLLEAERNNRMFV